MWLPRQMEVCGDGMFRWVNEHDALRVLRVCTGSRVQYSLDREAKIPVVPAYEFSTRTYRSSIAYVV